jgi:hypothetical protein
VFKVKFAAKSSSTEPASNFNKQLKPSLANAQPLASQDITSKTTELPANQENPFLQREDKKGTPATQASNLQTL